MGMDAQKDSLQDIKKGKKPSYGEENSINWEKKGEEDAIDNNGARKGEEEPLCTWDERMELPTFEGNGPQGQTRRVAKVFEVQNITQQKQTQSSITWKKMQCPRVQDLEKKSPRTFLWKILQQLN